ncbi:MAG: N-acetyltransferase [Bacteroidetes bacterium]|nr:N-acetyltransferase [Bacteroidota bacterium]
MGFSHKITSLETISTSPKTLSREKVAISSFDFCLYDTILEVPVELWGKVVPEENVLMHREYLLSLEQSERGKLGFHYLLILQDEKPVGAVYFQSVHFGGEGLAHFIPTGGDSYGKRLFNKILALGLGPMVKLMDMKLLVSGNIFMTGENGIYFRPGLDKATCANLLRQAAEKVVKRHTDIRIILISELSLPHSEFDIDFNHCSYHEVKAEADMSMTIPKEWKSFDDYLQALSSKYRVRARKVYRTTAQEGIICREFQQEDFEKYRDRLYHLYNQVMVHSQFKLAILSKGFFSLQKDIFPTNYHLYGYFREGQLIGFISSYHFGQKMEIHYCGMEPETNRPCHLYQRMIYDMLDLGIRQGVSQLHFGRTAPEIKSTIGAVPTHNYAYVKHLSPLFNLFFTPFLARFLQPKEYVYRNPFKRLEDRDATL